jgi:hypothetical protein
VREPVCAHGRLEETQIDRGQLPERVGLPLFTRDDDQRSRDVVDAVSVFGARCVEEGVLEDAVLIRQHAQVLVRGRGIHHAARAATSRVVSAR